MNDPVLLNFEPRQLRISSEFLSKLFPFLSKDLCCGCSQSLSDRILSIHPESQNKNKKVEDELEYDCYCHSLESWKNGVQGNSSLGKMVYENNNNLGKNRVVAFGNADLAREQIERIRFMNVKPTDFIGFESIHGKRVNILEGLELHTGIFNAAEQKRIVDYVAYLQEKGRKGELKDRTYSAPIKWMAGKGRQTIQFGCCYNYAVDNDGNLPGILPDASIDPLPDLFKEMIRRLVRWHVIPPTCVPDSCIVNVYEEGDCIPPHIDNHEFVRPFCTVSFLSECNILFGSKLKIVGRGKFKGSFAIPLPVGSVLVLNGNAADVAMHCVPAVPTKRISITFRRMKESKRPSGYIPEPDLEWIQPLAYEVQQEETIKQETIKPTSGQKRPRPNNDDGDDGGWIHGMGSAPRSFNNDDGGWIHGMGSAPRSYNNDDGDDCGWIHEMGSAPRSVNNDDGDDGGWIHGMGSAPRSYNNDDGGWIHGMGSAPRSFNNDDGGRSYNNDDVGWIHGMGPAPRIYNNGDDGGWIHGMGSAHRSYRFSEPREWMQY